MLAVIVARHLGSQSLGVFASFYGFAQAFGVAVDFGLGAWLLRGLTAEGGGEMGSDDADLLVSRALTISRRSAASLSQRASRSRSEATTSKTSC